MTIPTHTIFHSQQIYCFIQTPRQHQVLSSFSVSQMCPAHCSYHGSLSVLHSTFLEDFEDTLFTLAHLLGIHLLCCAHKSELAFNLSHSNTFFYALSHKQAPLKPIPSNVPSYLEANINQFNYVFLESFSHLLNLQQSYFFLNM